MALPPSFDDLLRQLSAMHRRILEQNNILITELQSRPMLPQQERTIVWGSMRPGAVRPMSTPAGPPPSLPGVMMQENLAVTHKVAAFAPPIPDLVENDDFEVDENHVQPVSLPGKIVRIVKNVENDESPVEDFIPAQSLEPAGIGKAIVPDGQLKLSQVVPMQSPHDREEELSERKAAASEASTEKLPPRPSQPPVASTPSQNRLPRTPSRASIAATLAQESAEQQMLEQWREAKKGMVELDTTSFWYRFGAHPHFGLVSGVVILANLLYLSVQTDILLQNAFRARDGEDELVFKWVIGDAIFCVLFVAELVVRILAYKWIFYTGREKWWNIFDTFVVVSSIVEVVSDLVGAPLASGLSLLKTARVIRIVRLVRVASSFSFVRNLKTMLYSLAGCVPAFFAAVTMLFVMMYIFGVLFMENVKTNLIDADASNLELLRDYYGSIGSTLWTLLAAATGGYDWADVAQPLIDLNAANRFVFATYLLAMTLGLLNILNGIFVNVAVQASAMDKELEMDSKMRDQNNQVKEMVSLFAEADVDHSGCLSWDEFKHFLTSEDIKHLFMVMELDLSSLGKIWRLLDTDDTGTLDIKEFVTGCMHLKGFAKTVDLVHLQAEVATMLEMLTFAYPNYTQKDATDYTTLLLQQPD